MNGSHHWDGRPAFTQSGWSFDGVGEAPPPGVSPAMFRLPAPPAMGMPNGGLNYPPWNPPPAPQGPAWGVPLQQQGNFHMMPMQRPVQQVVRVNPEVVTGTGALPREPEREAVSTGGPDGGRSRDEMVQRGEKAARQAYEELVSEGKHISVSKLSQRTLSALGISSFELLGFRMQDVPCLRNLALVESKVGLSVPICITRAICSSLVSVRN